MTMLALILVLSATDPLEQLSDPAYTPPGAASAPVEKPPEPVAPKAAPAPAATVVEERVEAKPPMAPLSLFNAARLPWDHGGFGFMAGYGGVEGNHFLQLTPLLNAHGDTYLVELGAPVNLTLSAPNDPGQRMWLPRRYDWDEWRDYLKILRELRLGKMNDEGEGFVVEAGRLDGVTLRQGSLVRRYSNNLLADTTRTALGMQASSDYFQSRLFLSDATWESPLFALSLGVTPAAGSSNRMLSSLSIGASYAAETFAPLAYRTDDTTGVRQANVQRTPQTTGRGLHGFTADIGLSVVSFSIVRLRLYTEFGMMIAFGNSIAAGLDLDLHFGLISVGAGGEYRNFSDKWIPGYFGSFHEVERFSFLSSRSGSMPAKAAMLEAGLTAGARVHGGMGQLRFSVGRYLRIFGALELGGYDIAQQLALHLESQPFGWLTLFATYQKRNYAAFSELFRFTDTDMLRSGLQVSPVSWLVLSGYAGRAWYWSPAADAGLGNIVATYSIGGSLGVRFPFKD